MSGIHFGTLEIDGFRALRRFRADGLGRVTLLTGRNNTGKSTVLEAIRILASNASLPTIFNIMRFREESSDREQSHLFIDGGGQFSLSSLFHGFPDFSSTLDPIRLAMSEGRAERRIALRFGSSSPGLKSSSSPLEEQEEGDVRLFIQVGDRTRALDAESFGRAKERVETPYFFFPPDETALRCHYVSPNVERTSAIGRLWDEIALSEFESVIVDALRIIDPRIEAVSMVGGEVYRNERRAIVRAHGIRHPVPLRSFGDGLYRIFSIAMNLVTARNGILLIDEFENGMHHAVQESAWRLIFKLAAELDVQVLATTHSWDAVASFQRAATESHENGVLVRLSRRQEEVFGTTFSENELATVTREHIEVR